MYPSKVKRDVMVTSGGAWYHGSRRASRVKMEARGGVVARPIGSTQRILSKRRAVMVRLEILRSVWRWRFGLDLARDGVVSSGYLLEVGSFRQRNDASGRITLLVNFHTKCIEANKSCESLLKQVWKSFSSHWDIRCVTDCIQFYLQIKDKCVGGHILFAVDYILQRNIFCAVSEIIHYWTI